MTDPMELSRFASAEAAGLIDLSRLLVALGDPIRQQIVLLLSRERLNVVRLAGRVHLSRPAVSYQIKVLVDAGILRQERAGREHLYQVDLATLRLFQDRLGTFVELCRDAQPSLPVHRASACGS